MAKATSHNGDLAVRDVVSQTDDSDGGEGGDIGGESMIGSHWRCVFLEAFLTTGATLRGPLLSLPVPFVPDSSERSNGAGSSNDDLGDSSTSIQ